MPRAEVTLPGSTSSVPAARRFVESIVSAWGHPDLGWSAALVVSELAANAALHARTPFTVSVDSGDGGTVRVEVSDGSRRLPLQRSYGADATTGRGLRLVQDISSSWGVIDRAGGKTVWVVLDQSSSVTMTGDSDDADVNEFLSAYGENPSPSGPTSTSGQALSAHGGGAAVGVAFRAFEVAA